MSAGFERVGERGRAIEDHAQAVVVFAEVGILHHLAQIFAGTKPPTRMPKRMIRKYEERLRQHGDAPHALVARAMR